MSAPETETIRVTGRQLLVAVGAAIALAAAIVVPAVLPAEYGIDPLGTGRALGLVHSAPEATEPEPPPTVEAALAPAALGPSTQYGASYRVDHQTFQLGPYEFLEYKYHLPQGGNMIFSWQASDAVIQDFHGAPDGKGSDAEVSIDKQPRTRASGALTAPFAGMHGWYWENPGADPMTIELTSAGFFSRSVERRSNGARRTHELRPPESHALSTEVKP